MEVQFIGRISLVSFLFAGSTFAGGSGGVVRPETHVFASPGGRDLRIDVFRPDAPGPVPAVVYFHGGGWVAGTREDPPVAFLAEHGYAVASAEYRFSQEALFPAQLHDAKAAVRWLRANAADLGIDPDRIAVVGCSAGAHLAMLLGTTAGRPDFDGDVGDHPGVSTRVAAVAAYAGASDFLLRAQTQPEMTDPAESVVRRLLGAPPRDVPDVARMASPAWQVGADAAPLLILHGAADDVVLPDQAERMRDAYREAGRDVSLHLLDGVGHQIRNLFTTEQNRLLAAFLMKHLS